MALGDRDLATGVGCVAGGDKISSFIPVKVKASPQVGMPNLA